MHAEASFLQQCVWGGGGGGGGGGATGLLNKGGGVTGFLWNFHRYRLVSIIRTFQFVLINVVYINRDTCAYNLVS